MPPKRRRVAPKKLPHGMMLRTSERSVLNRCRFQHDLSYTHYLKPRIEAPPLRFGTLVHQALEVYYTPHGSRRRKPPEHPAATFEKLYAAELERTARELPNWRDDDDVWHTHLQLGIVMLEGYVDRWLEQDKEYVTLATEQTFQYPIIIPSGEPPLPSLAPRIYVGTFDRVLFHRPTKRLLLGDFKTTKDNPLSRAKHLTLDEQAGAYWAYAPLWLREAAPEALQAQIRRRVRALPPVQRRAAMDAQGNLKFDGILYDFLSKRLADDRPLNRDGQALNKDGTISKRQPAPRYHRELVFRDEHDRREVMQRIYEDAIEIGQLRSGELAVKKSPDQFHCMMCPFTDQCELHETGADWRSYQKATTFTYDPYSAHAITEDEHEWGVPVERAHATKPGLH